MLLQFKTTVYHLTVFWNAIYLCDGKATFSASLLQSSESHDPSEIIPKYFSLASVLKTVAAYDFCKNNHKFFIIILINSMHQFWI